MIFIAIIILCSICFTLLPYTRPYVCMALGITYLFLPQIQPIHHDCDVLIHENLLESHASWKEMKEVVCKWDSKNDLLSHVAGAKKPLLIIAHGKGVLGESFIGKASDPVSYTQIKNYKKHEVGIASCRGKGINILPRPFEEDGLWVWVDYGEALTLAVKEINKSWKEVLKD